MIIEPDDGCPVCGAGEDEGNDGCPFLIPGEEPPDAWEAAHCRAIRDALLADAVSNVIALPVDVPQSYIDSGWAIEDGRWYPPSIEKEGLDMQQGWDHSNRFRTVSDRYPRRVAEAYDLDIARAAGDSDEVVAANVAAWELAQGLPVRDWRAMGTEEGRDPERECAYPEVRP